MSEGHYKHTVAQSIRCPVCSASFLSSCPLLCIVSPPQCCRLIGTHGPNVKLPCQARCAFVTQASAICQSLLTGRLAIQSCLDIVDV
ncbi:unnamed protein product [Protopolystoma xenopodis]|uniref:Uncharacterized protein n=1 Tax=Protopolystoma xenopodis TaxID=117903 RepID=A0A3S5CJ26_9PLAT|nr:unnamed protein product [Protopolystoma xenopodis]